MTDKDFQQIDAYLQGELSEEERLAVEVRAQSSREFREALRERQRFTTHLRAEAAAEELRPGLEAMGEKYFPQQQKSVVKSLRPWWARASVYGSAAAVLLLVALALTFLFPRQDLYSSFAQHDPLSLTERGGTAADAAAAETAFNAGEFGRSIPLLERYLEGQSDDERAKLALGIALLESNQDEKAIALFNEIAERESSLAPYGNWYLALAAVKRGDTAEARIFLDKIPSSDTYLMEKVARLKASL